MKWHIGCSGFMYREWKEIFYPENLAQKNWLAYYATQFDTFELNSSFYKFPEVTSLNKFYDQTPDNFSISLKVPRLITHYKQMKDCNSLLKDFYNAVEGGLKEKVGCVLFQYPPKFSYTEERLQLLVNSLNHGFKNVAEFRHESWLDPKIIKVLAAENVIVSGLSHPILPNHQEILQNKKIIYYRFHGIPELFYSKYSDDILKEFYAQMKDKENVDAVYIYFNNTASLAAIENAMKLKSFL